MHNSTPKMAPEQEAGAKVVYAKWHGHTWKIYVANNRGSDLYKVPFYEGGKRRLKSFTVLSSAEAFAKDLLKAKHGAAQAQVVLSQDEQRDARTALNTLKAAGLQLTLEGVCRQFAELAQIVGSHALLSDVARKYAASRGQHCEPVTLKRCRDAYTTTLESAGRSKRYVAAIRSFTGMFCKALGDETLTNQITREDFQKFIDTHKAGPRAKLNIASAVKTMCDFAKTRRWLPQEWEETEHIILPLVKNGRIHTYTPEDLIKMFIVCPKDFLPSLALQSFAGVRSQEVERLSWRDIRLRTDKPEDRVITLHGDIAKTGSRRTIPISDTLYAWLAPRWKSGGLIWAGSHDAFYRVQQRIAKNAGLKWKQNALRHTAISVKVALSKDVPRVAFESGNSVNVIKRCYMDLLPPSQAAMWMAVSPTIVANYKAKMDASMPNTPAMGLAQPTAAQNLRQ